MARDLFLTLDFEANLQCAKNIVRPHIFAHASDLDDFAVKMRMYAKQRCTLYHQVLYRCCIMKGRGCRENRLSEVQLCEALQY